MRERIESSEEQSTSWRDDGGKSGGEGDEKASKPYLSKGSLPYEYVMALFGHKIRRLWRRVAQLVIAAALRCLFTMIRVYVPCCSATAPTHRAGDDRVILNHTYTHWNCMVCVLSTRWIKNRPVTWLQHYSLIYEIFLAQTPSADCVHLRGLACSAWLFTCVFHDYVCFMANK